ncbi:MAG: ketol-acid reductoisomerase, partial [Bdellovibrionales bacterium]|nr:ketol-acid reductoisomerase [Bdellovibrionales bacterium]
MATLYWEKDVDASALKGKRIAVLGYGSQGRAQALNLRDSGLDVVIGVRPGGPTWKQAEEEGFKPLEPAEAVRDADLIAVLTPDMAQAKLYRESIEPNVKAGATLLFSHGFNIHYGQIKPPKDIDIVMIAPKSPGALVRQTYVEGHGVPCLVAVYQDASGQAFKRALGYADGLGGTKAGVIETTFGEETETDLFG